MLYSAVERDTITSVTDRSKRKNRLRCDWLGAMRAKQDHSASTCQTNLANQPAFSKLNKAIAVRCKSRAQGTPWLVAHSKRLLHAKPSTLPTTVHASLRLHGGGDPVKHHLWTRLQFASRFCNLHVFACSRRTMQGHAASIEDACTLLGRLSKLESWSCF
jgi:hypothetical protein